MRKQLHKGAVTALTFVDDHSILTGSNDKKILYLYLGEQYIEPTIIKTYELKVRCTGMNIDGLSSEKERTILQNIIKVSKERS